MKRPTTWIVCPVCHGEGRTVNPDIDAHGLTHEDFAEDPDFAESYWRGDYDIQCRACNGLRVITKARLTELSQHAEDRRLRAAEDGHYESWSTAGDYRYG